MSNLQMMIVYLVMLFSVTLAETSDCSDKTTCATCCAMEGCKFMEYVNTDKKFLCIPKVEVPKEEDILGSTIKFPSQCKLIDARLKGDAFVKKFQTENDKKKEAENIFLSAHSQVQSEQAWVPPVTALTTPLSAGWTPPVTSFSTRTPTNKKAFVFQTTNNKQLPSRQHRPAATAATPSPAHSTASTTTESPHETSKATVPISENKETKSESGSSPDVLILVILASVAAAAVLAFVLFRYLPSTNDEQGDVINSPHTTYPYEQDLEKQSWFLTCEKTENETSYAEHVPKSSTTSLAPLNYVSKLASESTHRNMTGPTRSESSVYDILSDTTNLYGGMSDQKKETDCHQPSQDKHSSAEKRTRRHRSKKKITRPTIFSAIAEGDEPRESLIGHSSSMPMERYSAVLASERNAENSMAGDLSRASVGSIVSTNSNAVYTIDGDEVIQLSGFKKKKNQPTEQTSIDSKTEFIF